MKRDWEIIRAVLFKLEESPTANTNLTPAQFPKFPEQEVAYNMRLLDQAGYISGKFLESGSGSGEINAAIVKQMTHAGHELLDTIRSDSVWGKTKDKFKAKGLEMTFDLVTTVGKQIMESLLS
jgi:Hypothetical protein (DUF2513)